LIPFQATPLYGKVVISVSVLLSMNLKDARSHFEVPSASLKAALSVFWLNSVGI
jgi:hypothetical protein